MGKGSSQNYGNVKDYGSFSQGMFGGGKFGYKAYIPHYGPQKNKGMRWMDFKTYKNRYGPSSNYQENQANSSAMKDMAQKAVDEAKTKQEASKASALGYFSSESLAANPLIDTGQQSQLLATRRAQLGAYGQNLQGKYANADSGVESGVRRQIGMGIAGRQANLPIETQLEVSQANRTAALGVAREKSGIQQNYQYDPGLEYIKQLGFGQGYQSFQGSGQPSSFGGGGSMRIGGGKTPLSRLPSGAWRP